MRALIYKELRLAMHPVCLIFLGLSALLLVPGYPYLVTFFYTTLGLFFVCLQGRENQDVFFTMLLPVERRALVLARFALAALLELAQLLTAALCAVVRALLPLGPNPVGMDANVALFASALVMLGLFHLAFFEVYYRNVDRVGRAFLLGSAVTFLYIVVSEALVHIVPFFRDVLDTPDPAFLPWKLAALGLGLLVYDGLTALACRRAVRHFQALSI